MLSKEVIQPASQEMLMSIRVCYRGKSFNRGVMSFWENAEAYTNHSIKITLQYFYFSEQTIEKRKWKNIHAEDYQEIVEKYYQRFYLYLFLCSKDKTRIELKIEEECKIRSFPLLYFLEKIFEINRKILTKQRLSRNFLRKWSSSMKNDPFVFLYANILILVGSLNEEDNSYERF